MRHIVSVLICLSVIINQANPQGQPECEYLHQIGETICRKVISMHDLSSKNLTWTKLMIHNDPEASLLIAGMNKLIFNYKSYFLTHFILEEHVNPHLREIQNLDISSAGELRLSDHGFKDFATLEVLNMSNGQLKMIKSNWFSTTNLIGTLNASHNELTQLQPDHFSTLQKTQARLSNIWHSLRSYT